MACLVWNNVNFLLNNYVLDQEMDGAAITQTFGTCVGPDFLRDVVSKFGVRIKVYTAIRTHLDKDVKANVRNIPIVLFKAGEDRLTSPNFKK